MHDLVKRVTICKLLGHDWAKSPYPRKANGDGTGEFLRCLRCRKEDHHSGTVARGVSPFFH